MWIAVFGTTEVQVAEPLLGFVIIYTMACGQDVPGANESSCAPRIYPAQGKRYGFVTLSRVSGRKTLLDALNEKLLAIGDTKWCIS